MRKYLIICLSIFGLQECSPKIYQHSYSAQVVFLNKDEEGTINLNSMGFGKDENAAIIDAQINAFNTILFKGIPSTDLSVPLIENENDAKSKHNEYFTKLFGQGFYQTFLMTSTLHEAPAKVKGGKLCSVDLKINFKALRIDLEQNNIIRKFGF